MTIINPTTSQEVKDKKFNPFVDKVIQYLYDHHNTDFCKLIKLSASNLAIDYGTAKMTSAFYNSLTGAHVPHPRPYSFTGIKGNFYLCKDWQEKNRPSDNRDYMHLQAMIANKFSMYKVIKVDGEFVLADAAGTAISAGSDDVSGHLDVPRLPLNIILYGPPGTGKTYHTIEKAVEIIDGEDGSRSHVDAKSKFDDYKSKGRIVFTTFHQSMSYEDFIEGIKPGLGSGSLNYKIEDGIFKQISDTAKDNLEKRYVLIIDEINRGNVANIFGELITLIEEDKRLGNSDDEMTCTLPYSKKEFGIPNNLYIIGTMNTADRSVEALDTALRRRFTFEEMMPKPELLSADVEGVDLQKFLNTINKRICLLKDREHQIGHSYFMNVDSKDALIDVIFKNVIPLLQEYFYGDYEKIQMVLGDKFIHREKPRTEFAIKDGNFDNPEYIYSIVKPEEITADIDAALESINFGFSKPDGEEPAEGTGDAE